MSNSQLLKQAIVLELERIPPEHLPALYDLVKRFATAKARRRRPHPSP
jgi:hypothetical protein